MRLAFLGLTACIISMNSTFRVIPSGQFGCFFCVSECRRLDLEIDVNMGCVSGMVYCVRIYIE